VERLRLDQIISEPSHMIVRHIERWPLRSALTALGVSLAGALLIGSLYVFDSVDGIIESFYFRDNRQDAIVDFFEPRSARSLYEIRHWPGVLLAEPQREVPVRLRSGHLTERVAIYGVAQGTTLRRFIDADGRAFDIPAQGLVLSDKLAELLDLSRGDPVTVEILEGERRTTELMVTDVMSELIGVSAYMDMQALNRLSGEGPAISGARLSLDDAQRGAFLAAIKEAPAVGMVVFRGPAIRSFRQLLAENLYIVITFYTAFGAIVAFGVIYNTARIGLSERGRELASLRVLGFTKAEASYILIGELAVLILLALPLGGLLGTLLAWTMSSAMETKLFRVPLIIDRSTYGFAALVLLASALVSLTTVARRVARFDLVAVLKARE
jgi:putative ABC transport system permease protein